MQPDVRLPWNICTSSIFVPYRVRGGTSAHTRTLMPWCLVQALANVTWTDHQNFGEDCLVGKQTATTTTNIDGSSSISTLSFILSYPP